MLRLGTVVEIDQRSGRSQRHGNGKGEGGPVRAHAVQTDQVDNTMAGWVVAHDVRDRDGKRLVRKGGAIDDQVLARWSSVRPGELHLLELDADDVHEDAAGLRVAHAVAAPGIRVTGPIQSRYNLVSEHKGLLRVDVEAVRRINSVDGVTVFSLLDRQPVVPGKIVAGVKVTPIAIPAASLDEVERIAAAASQAPLSVATFVPRRAAVVATEGLSPALRTRFQNAVERKLHWYGSELVDLRFVDSDAQAVANAFREFLALDADLLMAAGGNTIDPLDPISLALTSIGAEFVHHGAPSHPGSMFWLARVGDVPIMNLASCSMYSRATVADLVLPLIMTGRQVTSADIIDLGHGGLLEREMAFRFPDYDSESSDEADEALINVTLRTIAARQRATMPPCAKPTQRPQHEHHLALQGRRRVSCQALPMPRP